MVLTKEGNNPSDTASLSLFPRNNLVMINRLTFFLAVQLSFSFIPVLKVKFVRLIDNDSSTELKTTSPPC